jgi:hypothetical protein
MRRTRKDATKVWHNPDLNTFAKRGGGNGGVARVAPESAEDKRSAKQHRAALEALFAPKREPEPDDAAKTKNGPASKSGGRIVLAPAPQTDARGAERQKLLNRLLIAEGRPGVSKAADAFLAAGFTFPEEQDVYLQLLEHAKEEHVHTALGRLDAILAGELPKRRAVLESRLRRIEQFAEEAETREAAAQLRRRVSGRAMPAAAVPAAPPAPVPAAPPPPSTPPPADPQ